jgi:hypothetical protein
MEIDANVNVSIGSLYITKVTAAVAISPLVLRLVIQILLSQVFEETSP